MLLESLEVYNFRNLGGILSCHSGLNLIFGDNGQGKTNWLEAIYLLATTKSFKTQRLPEAIRFGEDLATVRGRVGRSAEVHRDLQITLQGNTKSISINGKREPVTRYLGQLHAVAFTADEMEIIRGTPEARRKFLDRGVVSLHPPYVQTIADYNRVIRQKNRLLQDASESSVDAEQLARHLASWNEQLAALGAVIHASRLDYVGRLSVALEHRLFERENVTIRYVSSLEGKGDLGDFSALLRERLRVRAEAEIAAGYSLIGPHRDDLEILFDGRDMRTFGSSGQQRSALIMLDLAAIEVYHKQYREYPLFLIDDVDAELDRKRINHLLDYLEKRTQTFITTSKEALVEQRIMKGNVLEIRDGRAMVRTDRGATETGARQRASSSV